MTTGTRRASTTERSVGDGQGALELVKIHEISITLHDLSRFYQFEENEKASLYFKVKEATPGIYVRKAGDISNLTQVELDVDEFGGGKMRTPPSAVYADVRGHTLVLGESPGPVEPVTFKVSSEKAKAVSVPNGVTTALNQQRQRLMGLGPRLEKALTSTSEVGPKTSTGDSEQPGGGATTYVLDPISEVLISTQFEGVNCLDNRGAIERWLGLSADMATALVEEPCRVTVTPLEPSVDRYTSGGETVADVQSHVQVEVQYATAKTIRLPVFVVGAAGVPLGWTCNPNRLSDKARAAIEAARDFDHASAEALAAEARGEGSPTRPSERPPETVDPLLDPVLRRGLDSWWSRRADFASSAPAVRTAEQVAADRERLGDDWTALTTAPPRGADGGSFFSWLGRFAESGLSETGQTLRSWGPLGSAAFVSSTRGKSSVNWLTIALIAGAVLVVAR